MASKPHKNSSLNLELELTEALLKSTGQGEEECFIPQPQALVYSFIVPVTLIMIFNLFALGHTTIHIVSTRKVRKTAGRLCIRQ